MFEGYVCVQLVQLGYYHSGMALNRVHVKVVQSLLRIQIRANISNIPSLNALSALN